MTEIQGTEAEAAAAAAGPGDARLMARLMLGSAALGGTRLVQALHVLDRTPAETWLPAPRPSWRHAVIGAALEAPRWMSRARERARPVTRGAVRWGVRGWRMVRWLPGADRAGRVWQGWRGRAAAWAESGWREEIAARALARATGAASVELAMAVIAESPDVRQAIEDQSTGVARSALSDLREGGQRADELAERIARRLMRGRSDRR
jgi:hypothetical protein